MRLWAPCSQYGFVVGSLMAVGLVALGVILMQRPVPADPCGVGQYHHATAPETHVFCTEPGCGPSRERDGTNCMPTTMNRECLHNVEQCTATCSESYPNGWGTCAPQPPPDDDEEECEECDTVGDSPIVISLRGHRLQLTDAEHGVDFDLDADGTAERLSWTSPGADDAFLAMDRNGNGIIDDGTELFGNYTPQPASEEPNVFLALALYDLPAHGGDGDGRITSADAVFSKLRLWHDWSHDGLCQPPELQAVSANGIAGFDLDHQESRRRDRHGNVFRYKARVTMEDTGSGPHFKWAVDVFLVRQ